MNKWHLFSVKKYYYRSWWQDVCYAMHTNITSWLLCHACTINLLLDDACNVHTQEFIDSTARLVPVCYMQYSLHAIQSTHAIQCPANRLKMRPASNTLAHTSTGRDDVKGPLTCFSAQWQCGDSFTLPIYSKCCNNKVSCTKKCVQTYYCI